MKRYVLGVITASAAAPYLVAASLGISVALESQNWSALEGLIDLLIGMVFFGTFGLLIYGLPVLAFAVFAALILYAFDIRSIIVIVATASIIGLCFGLLLLLQNFDNWPLILGCVISGAVCGWIYWRIAIRQTPDNARPIIIP